MTFLGKSELRKNEDDRQCKLVKNKLWRDVATRDLKILRLQTTNYRWTRVPQVWSTGSSTGLMA